MIKGWKFFPVLIILAVCLGLLLVPAVGVSAGDPASGKATFLLPAEVRVPTGANFSVNVTIYNLHNLTMTSAGIDVMWSDASLLNVTGIDAGGDWGTPNIDKGWDNDTGEAWYLAGGSIANPNITSTYAKQCVLHFVAGSTGGVTTVGFIPGIEGETVIYDPDTIDILDWSAVQNMTVIVGDVFNLTVTSIGCCPINVSGGRESVGPGNSTSFTVPCSENVTLTAVDSDACCVFDNWTLDGTPATNPLTVSGMAANSTPIAIASCSVPQFNLTMNVTGNGTTTPASGTTTNYSCGYEVPITATANAGWWFVNWTTTGTIDEIANPTANSTTVRMDQNKTVTANFVELFTLTMNVTGNGTITPGNVTVPNGTDVAITATPDTGWHFVNWTTTGNISEIDHPAAALAIVTVDQNKTVTATFAINEYNLTINSTSCGNVTTPSEGVHTYDYGTVVDLVATPDADCAFLGWTGNVSTIDDVNLSTTNITMYGNYSIMARFGPHDFVVKPISLTFTTDEGENPPSQTLKICNTGNGTLNWSLSDGGTGWLSESPKKDSLPVPDCEDVRVSVDVAGMKAGDYRATITFTGSAPVQEVPVSLHIESAMEAMPVLPAGLSASALSITPQQVKPDQEVTISISVANTGGETGSYNAVLYINGAVEDSQSVSVAAGASKNVIFTVSKSQAGVYDVSLAGQSGQFEVVGGGGWFGGGGGLGTGGIIAIVVVVIVLIVAVIFILRGTSREV